MKYIIYLTTNQVNGKIYIGIHSTENPYKFDNYLGCGVFSNSPKSYMNGGTIFQRAVKKYGPKNFKRKTLKVFNTLEEAKQLEAEIVNEDFIKRTDVYNMVVGGGVPPNLSKKVYQFDNSGNLIKEWENQITITEYYNCYKDAIYESIKHKRSFKNCYWSNEPFIDINEYKRNLLEPIIHQYNLNGILLNTFYSVSEVSKKLDIENERIIKSMTNKQVLEDCYFLPNGVDIFETISWRNSKVGGKKEVHRYTLDGKYNKTFKSLADAAKELGLKSKSGISAAIKDPTKTSGGFKWSLIKSDTIPLFFKNQELKPVSVEVYDKENNLIKTFKSVTDCVKEYPYCRKVLRGERKSAHNCIFKYIS